jgi:anti-anti-sigma factor
MKIHTQTHGTAAVLAPYGPLVADDLNDLRAAVTDSAARQSGRVVIDMANVPYLDSAGIELLLETCSLSQTGRRPRLAALTETCRDALELTDVLPRLGTYDTVENALRSLQR